MTRQKLAVNAALALMAAALVLLSLRQSAALALLTGIGALLCAIIMVLLNQRRDSRRAAALARRVAAREAELQAAWQTGGYLSEAHDRVQLTRAVVGETRRLLHSEAAAFCTHGCGSRKLAGSWGVQGISGAVDAFDPTRAGFDASTTDTDAQCPVVNPAFAGGQLRQPIVKNGQTLACLCVANRQARIFSPDERELIAHIASQAGAVLERVELVENETARATIAERERLSREIHDTITQSLGWASFNAQTIQEYLSRGEIGAAQIQLDKQIAISRSLYNDARGLLLGLRTSPDLPLVAAVREYAARFSAWSGVATTVDAEGFDAVRLPPDTELQILRVVQEALSNVRKHANACNAYIVFQRADTWAQLTVTDDGQGLRPVGVNEGAGHYGMRSMCDRIEALGGSLKVYAHPAQGTVVEARIPIVYREGEIA
jgi:signal transduction histidine kinase